MEFVFSNGVLFYVSFFFCIILRLTGVCSGQTVLGREPQGDRANSNLPLAFASAAVLGFGPHRDS
jgi:hypothetical protein